MTFASFTRTVNFSVSPQYTNGGDNQPPRLTGYQVNNEVSVRLEDVSKLGMTVLICRAS